MKDTNDENIYNSWEFAYKEIKKQNKSFSFPEGRTADFLNNQVWIDNSTLRIECIHGVGTQDGFFEVVSIMDYNVKTQVYIDIKQSIQIESDSEGHEKKTKLLD